MVCVVPVLNASDYVQANPLSSLFSAILWPCTIHACMTDSLRIGMSVEVYDIVSVKKVTPCDKRTLCAVLQ